MLYHTHPWNTPPPPPAPNLHVAQPPCGIYSIKFCADPFQKAGPVGVKVFTTNNPPFTVHTVLIVHLYL